MATTSSRSIRPSATAKANRTTFRGPLHYIELPACWQVWQHRPPRSRGTLTAMRMADADDLVAVDVFDAAQVTGEPVSMTLVRRVVDDLLTHPPECGCGHCEAAAVARIKDVWDIASGWQKAVARSTSNRAAR